VAAPSLPAWPQLYAVSFSGFYLAMFAVLVPLILRPVAFKFRSKHEDAAWRNRWDWVLCITGLVPALLFGVAVGNVILGVPFRLGDDMRIYYDGSFFGLLTPFALLCGLVSLSMLLMHGAAWLMFKTDGEVASRAARYGMVCRADHCAVCGRRPVAGYRHQRLCDHQRDQPRRSLQPLEQDRSRGRRCMDGQLQSYPLLWLVPGIGLLMPLIVAIGLRSRREWLALLASGLAIAGIILTVGAAMFPMILPSSIDPRFSLTVWDSSSSHVVLFIMLVCVLIFLPLILAYTSWVYSVLRGKVDVKAIVTGQGHSY
jgi:cytochrome d ubiquinol oxidase subunit II